MKMKSIGKLIVVSLLFLISLTSFAGVSSVMPFVILSADNSIYNISTSLSSNNNFSLYNEMAPTQYYVMSKSLGDSQTGLSGNKLELAQLSILCNSIFGNNN